jgi:ribonuclease P protein component
VRVQRKFRLTRSDEFKRVRRQGKSYADPLVVLIALPNQTSSLQVGIAAGRTVGNAIHRNRAKRLLREAMRPMLPRIASGWDLVLVARPGLPAASLEQTRVALESLLRRAGFNIPGDES